MVIYSLPRIEQISYICEELGFEGRKSEMWVLIELVGIETLIKAYRIGKSAAASPAGR